MVNTSQLTRSARLAWRTEGRDGARRSSCGGIATGIQRDHRDLRVPSQRRDPDRGRGRPAVSRRRAARPESPRTRSGSPKKTVGSRRRRNTRTRLRGSLRRSSAQTDAKRRALCVDQVQRRGSPPRPQGHQPRGWPAIRRVTRLRRGTNPGNGPPSAGLRRATGDRRRRPSSHDSTLPAFPRFLPCQGCPTARRATS
jgi:hypothetical protein